MPGLSGPPDAPPRPPVAKKQPKTIALHGVTLVDDYHWLRDKTDPDVTAYLEAENAYTDAGTQHLAALRDQLYREMLGRIKETDTNVPVRHAGYWYYTRTAQSQAYPIFCRRKETLDAPGEVYLDQNLLAAGKTFHAFGGIDVSPNGRTLLYLEDLTAFREYTLYVKDLATGAILESIPNVWNGTAWADDNRTFFYVTPDAAKRGDTVWRHVIGTSRDQDARVFHEPNPLYNVSIGRSRSDQYVFMAADGYTTSEWRAIPSAAPATAPRVIAPRRPDVEYKVEHGNGAFYLLTNDTAKNFRILRAEDTPGELAWTDWTPHREDTFIEDLDVFATFAVVAERRQGLRRLRVIDQAHRASAGTSAALPQ